MFTTSKTKTSKWEPIDPPFPVKKIEIPLRLRPPMWCTCRVSPEQNSETAFFFSSRRNENAAELKDRDAFGARAHIAIEHPQKSCEQTGSQCDVIFAERIAQFDRIFARSDQVARNQFGGTHLGQAARRQPVAQSR